NRALPRALAHLELASAPDGFVWRWRTAEALDPMLWPVVRSAAELLVATRDSDLRVCEARDCAWIFLDDTKNHSRRSCEMKECGNGEKARGSYDRQRAKM